MLESGFEDASDFESSSSRLDIATAPPPIAAPSAAVATAPSRAARLDTVGPESPDLVAASLSGDMAGK
ncbi:hypothetical protein GCM10027262_74580 [Nocardia tengchongensis]